MKRSTFIGSCFCGLMALPGGVYAGPPAHANPAAFGVSVPQVVVAPRFAAPATPVVALPAAVPLSAPVVAPARAPGGAVVDPADWRRMSTPDVPSWERAPGTEREGTPDEGSINGSSGQTGSPGPLDPPTVPLTPQMVHTADAGHPFGSGDSSSLPTCR
jgi:hypothetical protein